MTVSVACAVGCTLASVTPLRAQDVASAAVLREGTLLFVAHATIGDFTGSTAQVSGAASVAQGMGVSHGWVEAPVGTLRTGNSRRDRDMRSVIEADKYPTVRFDATSVSSHTPFGPDGTPAVLHGTFSLHGVTRPVDVPVTVSRIADSVRVVGAFPLDVTAHGVGGLRRMLGMLRVNEVVDVRLTLLFVLTAPHTTPPPGTSP